MRLLVAFAVAALAFSCSKAEPHEAKPGATSPEAAPAAPTTPTTGTTPDGGATAPAKHPGTIVFVESDGTENVRKATDVPESIAWATVGGKEVPVVRVVKHKGGGRVEIISYGADGQVLARVLGHR